MTVDLVLAGFVSKELRELECLLHVHLKTGVTLMQLAGQMVDILQWLMAKSPGRSAFTGIQTVVNIPQTFRLETAALSMCITSTVHRAVISAIVALTKSKNTVITCT